MQVEELKVEAIRRMVTPRMKKEIRTFLGLTGYYRRFIPDYATIAAALSDITRKDKPTQLEWNAGCEETFQWLKNALCSQPILQMPDFRRGFIVQTDASDRGVGAVLSQMVEDGSDQPVGYFNRKLLTREEKYSTVEKECLAIKAFRVYLLGRPFIIQTDQRALEWLDRVKENNGRLTRWSLFLQPYQFTVQYRPGKRNTNADTLSRLP